MFHLCTPAAVADSLAVLPVCLFSSLNLLFPVMPEAVAAVNHHCTVISCCQTGLRCQSGFQQCKGLLNPAVIHGNTIQAD